ncbi:MAG: hypothetical protein EOP06_00965 [Proteobacteria bacterium]|jgi:hypothetical protein|nr:MAG: hypothetical protein EOP06_00965 [Pseudomonadota bacterium]
MNNSNNNQFFDILVAKEYEARQGDGFEKRTAWNRVGRAWPSKSGGSLSFELYMFPGQRYVMQIEQKPRESAAT